MSAPPSVQERLARQLEAWERLWRLLLDDEPSEPQAPDDPPAASGTTTPTTTGSR